MAKRRGKRKAKKTQPKTRTVTKIKYRRSNPGYKSILAKFNIESIVGLVGGYVGSDILIDLLGLKWSFNQKSETQSIEWKDSKKTAVMVDKVEMPITEAIEKGYLSKEPLGNVVIPVAMGFLTQKYGKGILGKISSEIGNGMIVNGIVELIEYITKKTGGKKFITSLQGLGQNYSALPSAGFRWDESRQEYLPVMNDFDMTMSGIGNLNAPQYVKI